MTFSPHHQPHHPGFRVLVTEIHAAFREARVWNTEQLVGYLYSTPGYSKRMLGDRVENFLTDVRL